MSVSLAIIQPQVSIVIDGEDPQVLTAIDADTLNGVTAGTTGLLLLATATAGAARTVLGVDSDDAITFGALTAPSLRASTSGGLLLLSSNGTTVATIGAGPGTGVTFAGGVNMQALGCTTVTASGIISSSKASAASPITDANSSLKLYDASLGSGLFGMQTSGAPYSYQFQVADATMAAYFPLHLQPRGGALMVGSTSGSNANKLRIIADTTVAAGPQHFEIGIPNTVGNRSGVSFVAIDGSLVSQSGIAGVAAQIISGTTYPNVVGRLDILAQNGFATSTVASFGPTQVTINPALILGTDPGGSELFRAGGSGRFSGNLLCGAGSYFSAQASGSAAPSLASRSAGTKVILYETFSAGVSADAAIGIESGFLWFGGGTSAGHKWYTNTTNTMLLSSAGALTTSGKLSANSAASSSTLTGSTVAQVISWLQTVFM